MKKLITLFLITIPLALSAYTWTPFGPPGVHTNDIVFNVGANNITVVCANDGLYLNSGGTAWDFYTTWGLPVKGAVPFNDTSFIFIMGNSSWSDGIYLFSLNSLQHYVLEWAYFPEFIYHGQFNDCYYVGYFYGVLISDDGINWIELSYFNNKHCVSMDCSYDNYVISELSNIYDIHYSGDAGKNWQPASCPYIISDLRFKCTGELYGIFPDFSNSSGLYSSPDYGQSWDLEAYSDNMSTVGYDAVGNIFTGWESTAGASEGVAIFNSLSKTFDFVNNGLPNKNINKFRINPIMSSIVNFTCTDSGIYIIQNYIVGIKEQLSSPNQISVFPNPFNDKTNIEINITETDQNSTIEIYNSSGTLIRSLNIKSNKKRIQFYREDLKAGVYFVRWKYSNKYASTRIVISD
ncbi:MAG: T9SS type A sorting domain-containing protein [Bacteroidales bacterium]|nr:T9SS type A sorting domain-containing protein [Bacteroidales bacterium]